MKLILMNHYFSITKFYRRSMHININNVQIKGWKAEMQVVFPIYIMRKVQHD